MSPDSKQGSHRAPEATAVVQSVTNLPGAPKDGMENEVIKLQLSEEATKPQWSEQADTKLQALVVKNQAVKRKWSIISRELALGFSSEQCYEHWTKVLNPSIMKNFWTPVIDKLAFEIITQSPGYKPGKKKLPWANLAKQIGCLGKQLRERWCDHLDPMIHHGPWSPEEERVLLQSLIDQRIILRKHKWALTSGRLQSELNVYRPNNTIKNHFNTRIKPRLEPIESYQSSATAIEHLEISSRTRPPRSKRSSSSNSIVDETASKRSRTTEDSLETGYISSRDVSTDEAESSDELDDEVKAFESCFVLPSSSSNPGNYVFSMLPTERKPGRRTPMISSKEG